MKKAIFIILISLLFISSISYAGTMIDDQPSLRVVKKEGVEKDVEVIFEELKEGSIRVTLIPKNKVLFSAQHTLNSKDINKYPITVLNGTVKEIKDLTAKYDESDKKTEYGYINMNLKDSFIIDYEIGTYFKIKIGWDSIIIDDDGENTATQWSAGNHFFFDSNKNAYAVFEDNLNDPYFSNSSDNSALENWQRTAVDTTTVSYVSGLTDYNNNMFVFAVESNNIILYNSTDLGKTWSSKYTAIDNSYIVFTYDFWLDSNNIIHLAAAGSNFAFYTNSTVWNNDVKFVNDQGFDDTDFCSIYGNTSNAIYITCFGASGDDIDQWNSHRGWGGANRYSVYESFSASYPDMVITINNDCFVTFIENSDLWFCNSTDDSACINYQCKELDSSTSQYPSIAANKDNNIIIGYSSTTTNIGQPYIANSTDNSNGANFQVRTDMGSGGHVSVSNQLYPETTRLKNVSYFVYTDTSSNVRLDNWTLPYTPPPTPPSGINCGSFTSGYVNCDCWHNITGTVTLNQSVYINGSDYNIDITGVLDVNGNYIDIDGCWLDVNDGAWIEV